MFSRVFSSCKSTISSFLLFFIFCVTSLLLCYLSHHVKFTGFSPLKQPQFANFFDA